MTNDKLADDLGLDKDFAEYIVSIKKETGRLPDLADLFLYFEAKASIEIDKDTNGQTHHG